MEYRLMKPYPLWKVVYEQLPREDSKTDVYTIWVKIAKNLDYIKLYTVNSPAWADIALKKLQEIFELYILKFIVEEYVPPMFEINSQVYKSTFVFPEQSCICGETIAGNQRYGEFSVDDEKFDYVRDFVFFYDEGDCLVKCNQLFLNGELLADSKKLSEICKSIGQEMCALDYNPDKLIRYIKEHYPNARNYICNGYCSYRINERSV
jgi:hypothetical protein